MVQQVVIAGGGVIGAATAYYLTKNFGIHPIVVEACTPACSSSGKAGGFLASDWCDGSPLGSLARKSFALHAELAKTLPTDVGYRRVRTHSVAIKAGASKSPCKITHQSLPPWVDSTVVMDSAIIGTEETTAQVHPEKFTKALLAEVTKEGGTIREHTKVVGIVLNADGTSVEGVRVVSTADGTEETLPADVVVFALGVWSPSLDSILPPSIQINTKVFSGLKVHSMVLADPQGVALPDALFLSYTGKGTTIEPEVYPRPDNSVYVCGVSSEEAPPELADEIKPREEAIATLREVAAAVNSELGQAEVLKQQACFLPCSHDGLPLIGALPGGVAGAYVATSHNCW